MCAHSYTNKSFGNEKTTKSRAGKCYGGGERVNGGLWQGYSLAKEGIASLMAEVQHDKFTLPPIFLVSD